MNMFDKLVPIGAAVVGVLILGAIILNAVGVLH